MFYLATYFAILKEHYPTDLVIRTKCSQDFHHARNHLEDCTSPFWPKK